MQTYSYLDQDDFRALYCDSKKSRQMRFFIEGIRCGKCVNKIESLRQSHPELSRLEVDLANQTVSVEIADATQSFAPVAQDIETLGFRAIPIRSQDDESELWKKEARFDMFRLAVAGFCAGQIMMLAFATYFGDVGDLKRTFEWLQFGLYLPVVTYVAWPFYRGFVAGVKSKSISIDGPMALASFLGFAVSGWNLIRGEGSIYFDSLSGFLFLILATRFWQKRTRFQYLRYLRPSALAESVKARLLKTDGTWSWSLSSALQKGNRIAVETGEWIPADGILESDEAVLDLSILSGEALPRRVHRGFLVKAGSKLLSEPVHLMVEKSGQQTFLGHLLSSLGRESLSETTGARISDRASQILLSVVFTLALAVLIFGLGGFEHRFERALALIILACPCAMAFGTPLAYAFAMKRAQELGMVLKSARVFDRLSGVKKIFLDKTGTLTQTDWQITNSSLGDGLNYYRQVILGLEAKSSHPIAFTLRELWSNCQPLAEGSLQNVEEQPGKGVRGKIGGSLWYFYSFLDEQRVKWFGLWNGSTLVWKFQLRSALQPGARQSIQELQKKGFEIFLLSGDSHTECERLSQELGISASRVHAELQPEDKEKILKQNPNSIMVGDGVNDSLALQAAQVGIAVNGSVDLALRAADVLFLKDGVTSIDQLFDLSCQARRQIRRNLCVALIYNSIGACLAVGGWVNPMVAALLMPASSMFIWGTTWWGMRK